MGAGSNRMAKPTAPEEVPGQRDSLLALLRLRANVAAQGRCDLTALHHAAARGHRSAVKILVDHGAFLEAQTSDPGVWSYAGDAAELTPLHLAVQNGYADDPGRRTAAPAQLRWHLNDASIVHFLSF